MGMVGAGIYVILNTKTNCRYCGISTNLVTRFNPRLEVVTELGFAATTMAKILVWWGTITYQNTPTALVPAPPVIPMASYAAPLVATIDGYNVDLERLMIRFVLLQLGAGGTCSNNLLAYAQYTNGSPNAVTVNFNWANNGNYNAGNVAAVWGANASW